VRLPQYRARVHAELLGEPRPHRLVPPRRLRPPAGRRHQQHEPGLEHLVLQIDRRGELYGWQYPHRPAQPERTIGGLDRAGPRLPLDYGERGRPSMEGSTSAQHRPRQRSSAATYRRSASAGSLPRCESMAGLRQPAEQQ
jgi:hypothetical protein